MSASSPDTVLADQTAIRAIEQFRQKKAAAGERLRLGRQEKARLDQELTDLKARLVAAYGTDDIAELEAKLAEMRVENTKTVVDVKAAFDSLEANLAEAERAA